MIRPSSMGRLMACPASYRLCKDRPSSPDGPENLEGTEAHDYAARVLRDEIGLDAIPDDEMRRAVEMYANVCRGYQARQDQGGIEDRMAAAFGGTEVAGTPDHWSVSVPHGLTVVDLKYGYRPVEAENNWQLATYAYMIWMRHWQRIWTPKTVNLIIVQPRGRHPDGPVRRWTFPGDHLPDLYNQISNGIGLALRPDSQAIPGLQCYRCPALLDCKANALAVLGAMDVAITGETFDSGGDGLAYEIGQLDRAADLIKNRKVAVEEQAIETLTTGGVVPGYGVTTGQSALRWVLPDPIAAAADVGADIGKPREAITPTQAISRKLLTAQQIGFMARRQPTAAKLKKINLKLATKLIGEVNNG